MSPLLRRWLILLAIILVTLALDQLSKRAVIDNLLLGETQRPIPALAPFFQITRSENRGAAFGLFAQVGDIFLILAVIIVAGMIFYYPRLPEGAQLSRLAFGLVCGGALGNALDRLQYGAVIDFIHYSIPGVVSNVSNLADHAIVGGVLLLLWESWRGQPNADAPQEATPAEPSA
jgi:signal peptidase II